jgi:hypothetical protein
MRRVRTVLVGVAARTRLLALAAAAIGIGTRGWVVGLAAGLLAKVRPAHQLHQAGPAAVGRANLVTLARATIVASVAAVVTEAAGHRRPVAASLTRAPVVARVVPPGALHS